MNNISLKQKIQILIRCARRARSMGYEEILCTESGFFLMKYDRVIRE